MVSIFADTTVDTRSKGYLRRIVKVGGCFLPTLAALVYYGLVGSRQYESEAHFIVRAGRAPDTTGGLLSVVSLGFSSAQDDTFAVNDFIHSRDAVAQLEQRLPLRQIYGWSDADFLARYPSILFGPSNEEFFKYYKHMVTVVFTSTTGITTLRARAFHSEDAQVVVRTLLDLGEQLVNKMNARIETDTIKTSADEVERRQERLIASQIALTEFRNTEQLLNPNSNASSLSGLISRLAGELAQTRAQLSEVEKGPSGSPVVPALRRRVSALEEQIRIETARIGRDAEGAGIAKKLGTYERLLLELEFARNTLLEAESDLTKARAEARRQRLYLETISAPSTPDYPTQPERLYSILTVLAVNLICLLVGWLITTGIREHGGSES